MSKAFELAADLEGIFNSEEIHANKAKEIASELRRLSAIEAELKAIKEAEPVAWANSSRLISATISRERGGPFDTFTCSEGKNPYHTIPLYTLEGKS